MAILGIKLLHKLSSIDIEDAQEAEVVDCNKSFVNKVQDLRFSDCSTFLSDILNSYWCIVLVKSIERKSSSMMQDQIL